MCIYEYSIVTFRNEDAKQADVHVMRVDHISLCTYDVCCHNSFIEYNTYPANVMAPIFRANDATDFR